MKLDIKPGRYVIAVSGGVDSVVLLHILQELAKERGDTELVVAHVDHGMRWDSAEDFTHVKSLAEQYGLPFYGTTLALGSGASEEQARNARYAYLESVQKDIDGDGIITAHHQDDVIETAFLNMLRGTHRKGFTSLASTDTRIRPLLHTPKKHIISYARANGLAWREDSTNSDTTYKRNAVRHHVVRELTPLRRQHVLAHIRHIGHLNTAIDTELANILHMQAGIDVLDRRLLLQLPHAVALEVCAAWLRRAGIRNFDTKTLSRIVVAAKTYVPGRRIDVNKTWYIDVNSRSLALIHRHR